MREGAKLLFAINIRTIPCTMKMFLDVFVWLCRCICENANGISHVSLFLVEVAHTERIRMFMWNNSWWWTIARIDWLFCAGAILWNHTNRANTKSTIFVVRALCSEPYTYKYTYIHNHAYVIITKQQQQPQQQQQQEQHIRNNNNNTTTTSIYSDCRQANPCTFNANGIVITSVFHPHSIFYSFAFRLVSYSCKFVLDEYTWKEHGQNIWR